MVGHHDCPFILGHQSRFLSSCGGGHPGSLSALVGCCRCGSGRLRDRIRSRRSNQRQPPGGTGQPPLTTGVKPLRGSSASLRPFG